MVPGRPVANMYGAMYGAHPMTQGIAFLQDLKLGQYCKLPPRVTFCMQMMGTVVGAILNCAFLPRRELVRRADRGSWIASRCHDAVDH